VTPNSAQFMMIKIFVLRSNSAMISEYLQVDKYWTTHSQLTYFSSITVKELKMLLFFDNSKKISS